MKKSFFSAVLAGLSMLFIATARAEGVYLGLGGGIQHTKDWALQLAVPIHGRFETHYTRWENGRHVGAIGFGYRWKVLGPVSFVLGGAYISRVTDNLLRHANAYIELRWRPLPGFSCQAGHYSSPGDDTGENVLLCGVHWRLAR